MEARKKKKILFVCHIASRSGAPLLLLQIIREFKKQTTIPFEILIVRAGELTTDFKALGKTYSWNKIKKIESGSMLVKPVNALLMLLQFLYHRYILFSVRRTSTVFLNTISNGEIHQKLLYLKCRFICYVHEMEVSIKIATSKETLFTTINNTQLFIACAQAVKNNLVSNHHVLPEKIQVLYAPVNDVCRDKNKYTTFITIFKNNNNISDDTIVIGVAANNEWRKGVDLFFPLICVYYNLFPDSKVCFVWKGFRATNPSSFFDAFDYQKIACNKNIILLPHGDDGIETIACFDIHLLISREDPYPLAILEAASFGIPTVCFSDAGGAQEFIENDCGYCTPYGDLIKMAEKLNVLREDINQRKKFGLNAQQKIKLRHANTAVSPFINLLNN
ncbi:MAG: glycosyltransferase family 4 protein [Ferruginibacter sp.]